MRLINLIVLKKGRQKGFTLIELVILIAILGILATIAMPYFIGYIEKVKTEICNINCLELEKQYNIYLEIEVRDHSELVFNQFIDEYDKICPKGGEVTYAERKFKCKIHSSNEEDDVPYI